MKDLDEISSFKRLKIQNLRRYKRLFTDEKGQPLGKLSSRLKARKKNSPPYLTARKQAFNQNNNIKA